MPYKIEKTANVQILTTCTPTSATSCWADSSWSSSGGSKYNYFTGQLYGHFISGPDPDLFGSVEPDPDPEL